MNFKKNIYNIALGVFILLMMPSVSYAELRAGDSVTTSEAIYPHRLGMHFPNGEAAMDYAYETLFKKIDYVVLRWNYYERCLENYPDLEHNKDLLIRYSSYNRRTTAPDATCEIMFDINRDGILSASETPKGVSAFVEHAGTNSQGRSTSVGFNNFWVDDNWLARIAAQAYKRPHPFGLHVPEKARWSVVSGDTRFFDYYPHHANYLDQISLNGLAALSNNDSVLAEKYWNDMKLLTEPQYDQSNQRYNFKSFNFNANRKELNDSAYFWGTLKLFADKMEHVYGTNSIVGNEAYQYSRSISSHIRSIHKKHYSNDNYVGWATSSDPNDVINTETTVVNALALGSGADWSFEPGAAPLQTPDNGSYFLRPHGVLSAVKSLSQKGHMSYGPYLKFPRGSYKTRFNIRVPNPETLSTNSIVATLDVYNSTKRTVLKTLNVQAGSLRRNNEFTPIELHFNNTDTQDKLEFRVYWHDKINMDIGTIQVTKK